MFYVEFLWNTWDEVVYHLRIAPGSPGHGAAKECIRLGLRKSLKGYKDYKGPLKNLLFFTSLGIWNLETMINYGEFLVKFSSHKACYDILTTEKRTQNASPLDPKAGLTTPSTWARICREWPNMRPLDDPLKIKIKTLEFMSFNPRASSKPASHIFMVMPNWRRLSAASEWQKGFPSARANLQGICLGSICSASALYMLIPKKMVAPKIIENSLLKIMIVPHCIGIKSREPSHFETQATWNHSK